MRTIRPNLRALIVFGLASFVSIALLVGFWSHSSESTTDQQRVPIVRDLKVRAKVEEDGDLMTKLDGDKQPEEINKQPVEQPLQRIPDSPKIQPAESLQQEENNEIKQVIPKPTSANNEVRLTAIRQMALHAWNSYRNLSWGANELEPLAKKAHGQGIFGGKALGATIIDAADTLWIMGLTEQYNQARDFIRDQFDIKLANGQMSVFETTIRFLGGLLSLFALTKEPFYMTKAKSVADMLLPAFKTPTGIPKSLVQAGSESSSNYGWAGGSSILAEIGSLHLEFVYLSHITNDTVYREKVFKVRDALDKAEKPEGFYYNYISSDTGKWTNQHVSMGALGDSFYEYLVKAWLQSGKRDTQALRIMIHRSPGGLVYIAELKSGVPDHKMGHLACFCVGMLALHAANVEDQSRGKHYMNLAEQIGHTCHESYRQSATGLGPEMFEFTAGNEAKARGETGYIQRPEVIEGFFYLWRLTGNEKYREWVWDAVQAIEKYCRTETGYVGLRNVYRVDSDKDDVQQSWFLAETLKYAYLTFTNTSVISLNDYVFNTEAHLVPMIA